MLKPLKKMLSAVLCISFLLQSCGIFCVFAADGVCSIIYDDMTNSSKQRYNLGISHSYSNFVEFTYGEPIVPFPETPSRIVNERFAGWYADNGELVTKDTVITEDMSFAMGILTLKARWLLDDASIDDFVLTNKDADGDVINLKFPLTDADGNARPFDPDITEYYAVVDADTDTFGMSFTVREPGSSYEISYDGKSVAYEAVFNKSRCEDIDDDVDSSVSVTTEAITPKPGTNADFVIALTAPDKETTKTYTIHFVNTREWFSLVSGNTVYGLILRNPSLNTEAKREAARNEFNNTGMFRGKRYSSAAWGTGTEIKDGNIPKDNEYINYDKDETAMVVYTGKSFVDRGFTLYGEDGTALKLSDTTTVKRTVFYDKIPSTRFEDWNNAVAASDVKILTGKDGENVISTFEEHDAKPGIAKIVYEYTDHDGHIVSAKRNLIVVPQMGDLNSDTYVNSLDANAFNRNLPDDSTLSGRVLRYRAADVNIDGVIDDKDYDILRNLRNLIQDLYYDESVQTAVSMKPYTPPENPSPSKAHLYMDYLGKNTDDIITDISLLPTSPQKLDAPLKIDDIFWVGCRINNAGSIFAEGIYSITISLDYDTRYIEPAVLLTDAESASLTKNEQKWLKTMEKYNIQPSSPDVAWGSDYSLTGMTASSGRYKTDNSTASSSLENAAYIRRMVFDIISSEDSGSRVIEDNRDYYFIRIPMKVKNITPEDGRPIISSALGAEAICISTGEKGKNTMMWNNSDKSLATPNMKNYIEYNGDINFTVPDDTDAIPLPDGIYGTNYFFNDTMFGGGEIENAAALPPGLVYMRGINQIQGTSTWSGTYIFYINSIKYSITIRPAPMEIIPDDKGKAYGDENPELTFTYNPQSFKNGDNINSVGFTTDLSEPTLSCEGTIHMRYGETVPITAEGGGCHNYYFVYKEGTLTVDKRKKIDITAANVIPSCTSLEARENTFPYSKQATAVLSEDGFAADGVTDGDDISITYDVIYHDNKPGENLTVSLGNFAVDTEYGNGNDYEIGEIKVTTSNKGEISGKEIVSIEIIAPPKRVYEYGDMLDLSNGSIGLIYDNGDDVRGISFIDAEKYGLRLAYTDDTDGRVPVQGEPVTEEYHSARGITVYAADSPYEVEPAVMSRNFEIIPRRIGVYADDKSKVYGDANPELTYHFDTTRFVNGDTPETLSNFTPPTLVCNASATAQVGNSSMILISGGGADNYEFEYHSGALTITPRPIDIKAITAGIPVLTAKTVAQNPTASQFEVAGVATVNQMDVEGLVGNDNIRVNYTAVYSSAQEATDVTVGIKDVAIDASYARGRNYQIQSRPENASGGEVIASVIESFEIGTPSDLEYTYGETLDLSGLLLSCRFDNGTESSIGYDDFEKHGIFVTYGSVGSAAHDGDKLTVSEHDGKELTVVVNNGIYNIAPKVIGELKVNKKDLRVEADAKSMRYGDTPSLSYKYNESDFVYGETALSAEFRNHLTEPEALCEVTSKTGIGNYDITLRGGEADNYHFVFVPAVYTVNAREIVVRSITGGVPALSAKQVFEEDGPSYRVAAEAFSDSGNIEVINTVNHDVIKISYTAVYNSDIPVDQCRVGIEDITLVPDFAANGNYVLAAANATSSDGGKICEKQIVEVKITAQPDLEYTYGETLHLESGAVKITYDSGEVIGGIAFSELLEYDVAMTYTGTDIAPVNGEPVSVGYHDGKSITLTAVGYDNVDTVRTDGFEIAKKLINVRVVNSTSVYGEAPEFGFEYDSEDFVNGDTPAAESFTDGLTEPAAMCAANADSSVGDYPVTISGAEAVNYQFEYHGGTHTVTRRPITITRISGGVPLLTSAIVLAQPGNVHELAAAAENKNMEITNLIDGDKVRIKYTAVYTGTVPEDNVDVGVIAAVMDDDYEQSANYTIEQITDTASGGRICDKEINAVEIVMQPRLEYTYGDKPDLSGGSVKITYDSGLVEENLTFDKLSEHRISLVYEGTEDLVSDEDMLNVPFHNGTSIVLVPETIYDLDPIKTDAITVNKKILTFGECLVEPITYDGATVETSGVIALIGAEYDEAVTASGIFTFENTLAGEEKTVYITDVTLDDDWSDNYELAADHHEAKGTIEKADIVFALADGDIFLAENNVIVVNPPEFNQMQSDGGAEYEFSSDGGVTWQKENKFENLALKQAYNICVRIAETDNFNRSDMTEPALLISYANHIVVYSPIPKEDENGNSEGDDADKPEAVILYDIYTNVSTIEDEDALKEFLGTEINYRYFSDIERVTALSFPLEFDGEVIIYTLEALGYPSVRRGKNPVVEPVQPDKLLKFNVPYIEGYGGKVTPNGFMTRAQAAKIIAVISGEYDEKVDYTNPYSDVTSEKWYYSYVGFATDRGWIEGYEGKFNPDNTITREEFAAIIARYMKLENVKGTRFDDTPENAWSTAYITALADKGIVVGAPDGRFNPGKRITRAESITIINRVIERIPQKEIIDEMVCEFDDIDASHWAYYDVMAASCEYEYYEIITKETKETKD